MDDMLKVVIGAFLGFSLTIFGTWLLEPYKKRVEKHLQLRQWVACLPFEVELAIEVIRDRAKTLEEALREGAAAPVFGGRFDASLVNEARKQIMGHPVSETVFKTLTTINKQYVWWNIHLESYCAAAVEKGVNARLLIEGFLRHVEESEKTLRGLNDSLKATMPHIDKNPPRLLARPWAEENYS